jgi:hypothetical protein
MCAHGTQTLLQKRFEIPLFIAAASPAMGLAITVGADID